MCKCGEFNVQYARQLASESNFFSCNSSNVVAHFITCENTLTRFSFIQFLAPSLHLYIFPSSLRITTAACNLCMECIRTRKQIAVALRERQSESREISIHFQRRNNLFITIFSLYFLIRDACTKSARLKVKNFIKQRHIEKRMKK